MAKLSPAISGVAASIRAARPVQSRMLASQNASACWPRPAVRAVTSSLSRVQLREAVLAGHGQLRAGQGQRVRHRPDTAGRRGVARLRGAEQVPGLAAQVIDVGLGRKIGHDVSFTGPRSAQQAWQGRSP